MASRKVGTSLPQMHRTWVEYPFLWRLPIIWSYEVDLHIDRPSDYNSIMGHTIRSDQRRTEHGVCYFHIITDNCEWVEPVEINLERGWPTIVDALNVFKELDFCITQIEHIVRFKSIRPYDIEVIEIGDKHAFLDAFKDRRSRGLRKPIEVKVSDNIQS